MILHTSYGDIEVNLQIAKYCNNGGLYIGLITEDGELYDDLTVNLEDLSEPFYAYLNSNNLPTAEQFVVENGLGINMYESRQTCFCEYPLYYFLESRLRELCPKEMKEYFGAAVNVEENKK